MPRVTPFYAVKCNPEPGVLRLLQSLGTGFDCASKGELDMMLKMGVHPSRIIFAHPTKRPCDIRYAKEHGVEYTTFDTVSELHKIAALNPGFKCVLRIRADDPDARVPLGLKYGADMTDVSALLSTAKTLGLAIVGVSFHVGSACKNLITFSSAIERAREIFDAAEAMGFDMELLDIGGGFTGRFDDCGNVMFGEIATTINNALAKHFPPEMNVRVIAEPGRYFAETSATLFTPVYGQRERRPPGAPAPDPEHPAHTDYWITDGLYGSFNCILYDGQNPEFRVVRSPLLPPVPPELDAESEATVWGPTCDSADCVYKDISLPHLRNGDWLMWPNAGAYTVAGACDFNGINMTRPQTYYVFSVRAVDVAGGGGGEDGEGDGAPPPSTGALASAADSSRASDTGEE
mmetsp:Transcript_591/g.1599  ORF Transcript_591/g.1599 Transcript_591/m.1599 type:complete len:404 (-) Transcript_591:602-1813(-)